MYKYFVTLLILLSVNSCFASAYHVVQQQPVNLNPYYRSQNYYQTQILPRDLSALEKYSMDKIYPRENSITRLERLENLAFGSVQQGDTLTRYKNVESAILARPKYNSTKNSILGTLAGYFAGQATGITPSLNNGYSDNYYSNIAPQFGFPNPAYGSQRYDQFSNGIFGGGYGMLNHSIGNGSTVRILP